MTGQGHKRDSCETKPIPARCRSGDRRSRGPEARTNKANSPGQAGPAPGQTCETNPIRPEPHEGQVLLGKRVMVNQTSKRLRKNKANSGIVSSLKCQVNETRRRWLRSHCAKQSQFPPPCRSGDRRSREGAHAKQSQFPAAPGGPGPGTRRPGACTTKPNFPAGRWGQRRTQACGTKPIPATMPIRRSAVPGGRACETKPIYPAAARKRARRGGPERLPARGQLCETNPIR